MTKEEKFKNKSIKKKVNDAFNMIFRLYFATVALASLGLILLAVVPDAFRIPVLVICIVITVSYTHLDVYKRQGQPVSFGTLCPQCLRLLNGEKARMIGFSKPEEGEEGEMRFLDGERK